MHLIQIIRRYLGATQKELAQLAGISQPDLCEMETKKPYGWIDKYQKLSDYLLIPVHALVTNDCTLVPLSFFARHPGASYMECSAGGNAGLGRRGEDAAFVIPGEEKEINHQEEMFADAVERWLQHQKGALAASTMAGYQYYANDVMLFFREICPVRTVDLTSSMVEQYQNWERARRQTGYTGDYKKKTKFNDGSGIENTVKHRSTLIRSVLQDIKREGIVDRNVASSRDSRVNLPSPQRNEFPVLSKSEAEQLIKLLENEELWFKAAVLMALIWGLRRSEIIGLQVRAVDWELGQVVVDHTVTQQTLEGKNSITAKPFTKNKRAKCFDIIAPIDQVLKELIEEHKKNAIVFGEGYDHHWDGYLMRYADGKLVTPNALTSAFEKFIKKNGIKHIRLHDLRHSCASLLYANGADLLTIQEILGHAQLTTTIS